MTRQPPNERPAQNVPRRARPAPPGRHRWQYAVIFLGLGLLVASFLGYGLWERAALSQHGVRTEAQIVGYEPHLDRVAQRAPRWFPVYRFVTESGEQVEVTEARNVPEVERASKPVGTRVPIVYDPASPSVFQTEAQLSAGPGLGFWFAGLFTVGMFAAAVPFLRRRGPQTPQER